MLITSNGGYIIAGFTKMGVRAGDGLGVLEFWPMDFMLIIFILER